MTKFKYYVIYNPNNYQVVDIKKSLTKPNNSIQISKKQYYLYKFKPLFFPKFVDPNIGILFFDEIFKIKENILKKLKEDFQKVQYLGFNSKTINKKINSRKEDLENMRILLSYMQKNNLNKIQFRIYDNSFVEITQNQLQQMINELEEYGIELYKRKWNIEQKIKNTLNFKELISIKWNSYLELINGS